MRVVSPLLAPLPPPLKSKVQAKVHRLVCNNEDDDDDGVVADIRSRKDGGDEMNRKRCSAQLGSVDLVSYGSIRL
jgi:hypothetical protein